MVKFELRRSSVFRDRKKVGSFYFPPNLFHLKIGDNKIRITHVKSGGLSILLKRKGAFRYGQAAKMDGEILLFNDVKYSVAYRDIEGKARPSILKSDDSKIVAFSNLDGSMEYLEAEEPALVAVSILFLCIVRFAGSSLPDFNTYLGVLNKEFYGKFGKISTLFPAIVIYVAIATILASQFHSTGVWALVVLAGFAFVLGGSYLFLIFEYFRKSITITESQKLFRRN